jgi:hypothetical protein
MEVIARKATAVQFFFFLFMLVGIVLIAMGISPPNLSFVTIGLFATALGLGFWLFIKRIPKKIIRYDGKKLYFPKGESYCIGAIKKVEYRPPYGRFQRYHTWGKLTIYVENKTLAFHYVADVQNVHNRLIDLMLKEKERQAFKGNREE